MEEDNENKIRKANYNALKTLSHLTDQLAKSNGAYHSYSLDDSFYDENELKCIDDENVSEEDISRLSEIIQYKQEKMDSHLKEMEGYIDKIKINYQLETQKYLQENPEEKHHLEEIRKKEGDVGVYFYVARMKTNLAVVQMGDYLDDLINQSDEEDEHIDETDDSKDSDYDGWLNGEIPDDFTN